MCAVLGADNKPKAWSKYSTESSSYKKLHEPQDKAERSGSQETDETDQKGKKNERLDAIYGEHEDDPKFIEFMQVYGNANDIWNNDLELATQKDEDIVPNEPRAQTKSTKKLIVAANVDDSYEGAEDKAESIKLANLKISDKYYLKSLMNKTEKSVTMALSMSEATKAKTITNLFTIKIREIPFNTIQM